jgi:hypothetical protein
LQWSTVHQALVRRFGGQWQFAEGPPAYFQYDDLWATGGPITMSQVLAGTFDQVSDSAPHFGVWRISSVATANSGANMRGGGGWTSGAGGIRFRGVVMLWNTSAGSLQRIGFHESLNATAPGDGAWLEVVAGVATFKTASSPLTTANPTTATLSAFTWYTIHIWFTNNGVSARCVVINDSGTVVLDVSNTTNLPSGPDRFYAGAQALFTTASAQTLMDVDWLGWGYQQ